MSCVCLTGNGRRGCTTALLCICPLLIRLLYVTSTFQPYVMGSRLTASFNSKTSQSVSAPERKNAPARTQLQCLQFTQHRDTWNFCSLQTKSIRDHMFLHSTRVECGCSRLLTSLRHMVSLIVPNVVLIFRWVYDPEQLSLLACSHVYVFLLSQIHIGESESLFDWLDTTPPEPVCAMQM